MSLQSSFALPSHPDLITDKVLENGERLALWSADLRFRGPFTTTLLLSFPPTWSQYLSLNNLTA
eukprot:gene31177-38524_t